METRCRHAARAGSERGFSLLEVALSVGILSIILLGVSASMTAGLSAQSENDEFLQSQLLLQRVLEELKSSDFDDLPSFNGQFVVTGNLRADISVDFVSTNLVRLQVVTSSASQPRVSARAVTLVADSD